jgi:hypothetical protein
MPMGRPGLPYCKQFIISVLDDFKMTPVGPPEQLTVEILRTGSLTGRI